MKALRALLVADAAVAALVSDNVFLGDAPESASKPYIVAYKISGEHDYTLAGPSGLKVRRLQVDCWAKAYSTASDIADAAMNAISGYSGVVDGVDIQGVFIDSERDGRAEDPASSSTYRRSSFDVSISYC